MAVIRTSPVVKLTTAAAMPSARPTPSAPLMRPWTGMNKAGGHGQGQAREKREAVRDGSFGFTLRQASLLV